VARRELHVDDQEGGAEQDRGERADSAADAPCAPAHRREPPPRLQLRRPLLGRLLGARLAGGACAA
jgi:hypothetical protein